MSWVELQLGSLCVEGGIQTGPFGSQLHQSDYSEFGTPVVMPVDMVDGRVSTERIARVSDEHVSRLSRHVMREGDIVYARRGDVGRCSRVSKAEEGWLCGTGCLRLRPDEAKVDPLFLYYALANPKVVGWVRGHAIGATMPNLNTAILFEVPLRVPKYLETQRRIASILMAYDNLIENNRKQIALLEEAAQRLYKEWFIDLRFPGHEDVEIVDGLPQGWQEATVGDLCALTKVVSKERDRTPIIKYIGLEHMPRKSICLDTYGDVCSVKGNKLVFEAGDILFGKIRPYFHKVGFAQCDGVASADTIIMRPMRRRFGLLLGCVSSDDFVSYATKTSKTGTKMPRADWAAMEQYPVLIPDDGLLDLFEEKFTALASGIATLSGSSHAAREARDRLLPKLMSGEIEV